MADMSSTSPARDWKETVLLPRTDFAMRADLASREGATIRQWLEEGIFGRMLEARADAPLFAFHDGPPYANGDIHHGHALNKILKDFVVKYRSMAGWRVPFVPGWDCHGLPIEQKVDAELGAKKADLDVVAFREKCRAYASGWIDVQRESFKRLQVFADWDNRYATLDLSYERSITSVLADVVDKGFVYRGVKPVHWSWAARTALAEAEVEYAPYVAPSVYVLFRMIEPPAWLAEVAGGRPVDVAIWTTTPWTLPSNVAIVLHPELTYQVVDVGRDAPIVVAEALRDEVLSNAKIAASTVLGSFPGAQLVGDFDAEPPRPLVQHPFLDRTSVLLPADYVTTEQGTGCVHTAPGHGADDFRTGLRYGLPVIAPVDERGCYTAEVPDYEGEHVFKANPRIAQRLAESGRLLNDPADTYRVDRYPHCWRTKKPLIFRATAQWFLRVDHENLRGEALDAIGRTRWVPTWGENRIRGMIEQRPDWCISRQRVWGVPIPAFRCGSCGEHTLDATVIRNVAAAMEGEGGSNVWFERPIAEFLPAGYTCPHCGGGHEHFEKGLDTLDVWFDSGVSWAAVVRDRIGSDAPIDLYLEGSDQHRGWFHTSLLTAVAAKNDAPYRTVLTHGFIVDEHGRKYSKSSPNFEPLTRLLDEHGAEVFRLWVAMTDYRTDVTLSGDSLKQAGGAYRKIRNTIRFLLGNLEGFDPASVTEAIWTPDALDGWMLHRLDTFIERARRAYENYEFHILFHELLELCNEHLSAVYLDVLKDRMYCEAPDDPRRLSSQLVMWRALDTIVRAAAPVLSFTCDEAWPLVPRVDGMPARVFLADFPRADEPERYAEEFGIVERLLAVRGRVSEEIERLRPRKKGDRQPGQIGSSQEAAVTLQVRPDLAEEIEAHPRLLEELCIVSSITITSGTTTHESGVDVHVALASAPRCARCWNHRSSVGSSVRLPDLCGRCVSVVERFHLPAEGDAP